MPDRLIRITTALAVVAVAAVAAVISYRHAYELVHSHGETGPTARLVPFTVDGLIWAASMVILDASRRRQPAPSLAKWSLAVGIYGRRQRGAWRVPRRHRRRRQRVARARPRGVVRTTHDPHQKRGAL